MNTEDWNRPEVVQLINRYIQEFHVTLDQLRREIEQITGRELTISELRSHLRKVRRETGAYDDPNEQGPSSSRRYERNTSTSAVQRRGRRVDIVDVMVFLRRLQYGNVRQRRSTRTGTNTKGPSSSRKQPTRRITLNQQIVRSYQNRRYKARRKYLVEKRRKEALNKESTASDTATTATTATTTETESETMQSTETETETEETIITMPETEAEAITPMPEIETEAITPMPEIETEAITPMPEIEATTTVTETEETATMTETEATTTMTKTKLATWRITDEELEYRGRRTPVLTEAWLSPRVTTPNTFDEAEPAGSSMMAEIMGGMTSSMNLQQELWTTPSRNLGLEEELWTTPSRNLELEEELWTTPSRNLEPEEELWTTPSRNLELEEDIWTTPIRNMELEEPEETTEMATLADPWYREDDEGSHFDN
ncbi:unnamed protein product [Thelazia callipaeda]|uniref:Proteoglycan 4-like n=1 Tax=Thelazia callipaeda TaxID=103827 RepID=A0A0N5CYJ7_THECL|nr:unnamed protein product [Thelazia callipaeda]